MMRSPGKRGSNLDLRGTGDSDSSSSSVHNIARKRKQPDSELSESLSSFAKSLTTINSTLAEMKLDITKLTQHSTEIKNDISALRSAQAAFETKILQVETKQVAFSQEMEVIKDAIRFNSEQHGDLKAQLTDLQRKVVSSSEIEDSVISLQSRIDVLEQQARACNIEISNLPERRGENLITLVETIGSKIKFAISQRDIIGIHRVPHMANNDRPKNIIVRFSSVPFCDNVISAYRRAKGLKSDQLGIAGTPHTIYINEHLTLKKKLLFRECRIEAQKNNYKYVWVKHSTILVRKTDTSAVIAVRFPSDLQKLSAGTERVPAAQN